ncbi:Nucleotide-binding protein implicated in inhibition of septum formation [gamma proteobacterium HdN1]|nr:Nucleotide-binding protein implicated in inhibition of septum formation [gamma proteobacterium HdN1]
MPSLVAAAPDVADLYLASASPRRGELLGQIGVRFAVLSAGVDEQHFAGESPEAYVCRLAASKAQAGLQRALAEGKPCRPVLGADTTVVVSGQILGKPISEADACGMLVRLSDGAHTVLTAVSIATENSVETRLSSSLVVFRRLARAEMRAYWRSGEPSDKAGGYGIQGLAAVFVKSIQGSYSGIMGLPLAETAELLKLYRVPIWQPSR